MTIKPTLTEIADVMRMGGRSAAYLWMWENFDALKKAHVGRVNWAVMAQKFAALGLKSATGEPFGAEALRKTWHRVVTNKARNPGRLRKKTSPAPKPAAPKPLITPIEDEDDFEFHDLSGKPLKR